MCRQLCVCVHMNKLCPEDLWFLLSCFVSKVNNRSGVDNTHHDITGVITSASATGHSLHRFASRIVGYASLLRFLY